MLLEYFMDVPRRIFLHKYLMQSTMTSTTSSEASTPSTDIQTSVWYLATRTAAVTVIMPFGIVGNGFVLWFYGKNKKLTGQVYILAVAVIDLVACVLILPQMPLFELEQDFSSLALSFVLSLESKLHIFSYFGVQLVFALDQFIAVYWPFKYARLRRPINYGTIAGVCAVVAALEACEVTALVLTGSITESVENLLARFVENAYYSGMCLSIFLQ